MRKHTLLGFLIGAVVAFVAAAFLVPAFGSVGAIVVAVLTALAFVLGNWLDARYRHRV